ncbi:MAG TPA: type II toxin-antitoxin system PemK/MazF family toxin [Ktedonobacteraceae bacterium]|jgi:mRNA interferase MazF|nr:type II toxin-antitoxin system PemK/MazF family toxin [Ktedonobacteraceae bacterium]HLI68283.1 type II toxin-antitoxin system PemK/MazF family toxin [Ktedonobacteraceae bacterium]
MSSEAKASTPGLQQSEIRHPAPPSPRRGEIWDVNWSPGRGAEQQGTRPALIIQNDRGNASPSYPLTIVASMSRTERELPLHVRIAPTAENGLTDFTDVKCEQVMTIEKSRLLRKRGSINAEELARVDHALKLSFSLFP